MNYYTQPWLWQQNTPPPTTGDTPSRPGVPGGHDANATCPICESRVGLFRLAGAALQHRVDLLARHGREYRQEWSGETCGRDWCESRWEQALSRLDSQGEGEGVRS